MTFITKLSIQSNLPTMLTDMSEVLNQFNWNEHNQIGLRHRKDTNNEWTDAIGGLFDKISRRQIAKESDFNLWNSNIPNYTKQVLEDLAEQEKISWGRIRFMRLLPKTGLSIHTDTEVRYHLALQTNKNCIFSECFENQNVRSMGYNIPSNGYWYKVDTTKQHFVFNGSWEPRIHLVCCPININYAIT